MTLVRLFDPWSRADDGAEVDTCIGVEAPEPESRGVSGAEADPAAGAESECRGESPATNAAASTSRLRPRSPGFGKGQACGTSFRVSFDISSVVQVVSKESRVPMYPKESEVPIPIKPTESRIPIPVGPKESTIPIPVSPEESMIPIPVEEFEYLVDDEVDVEEAVPS